MTDDRMTYDRVAASRILARIAPAIPRQRTPGGVTNVPYRAHRMTPEAGSHLTLSQRLYLERFMRPCPPEQIVTATHRMTWTDSSGVPCTGHYVEGGLGPLVPIAVRETNLRLWRSLPGTAPAGEHDPGADLADDGHDWAADLDDDERAILAGTTTDREPREIFRIGIEAAGRALAQHALIAPSRAPRGSLAATLPGNLPSDPAGALPSGPTGALPGDQAGALAATALPGDAAGFGRAMARAGIFAAVAGQWYWELQASTFRRGMIPARFVDGGELRYTPETVAVLRQMKDATIADAHAVMARAIGEEGLTTEQAVHRYHDELDLISRQYALLEPGARPRCLALPTVLPSVVETYVETFAGVASSVTVVEEPGADDEPEGEVFHVPDMNCRHCTTTIRAVLESMDVVVPEVDLDTKRVVAEFRSPRHRERAFAAIRDSGYTVLGAGR